jgi:fimbrial chaperone protein
MTPTLIRQRRWRGAGWALAVFLAAGWACGAGAADLQVAPARLEFAAREQAQPLWLSNTGAAPLRAQIRVQRWTQANGQDRLAPTQELLASPPAVEIPPGGKQLVRIVRVQTGAPSAEDAFRVIVDELPPLATGASADGSDKGKAPSGLRFLMRYSVPLFVSTEESARKTNKLGDEVFVRAQLVPGADGAPARLTVSNSSKRRIKLSQLVYVGADGQRDELVGGLLGYVFPGQRMSWPVKHPPAMTAGGSLKARLNDDSEEHSLPLVSDSP